MGSLLSAISFASPLALLGLVALPALWWLLRATPPQPATTIFPPIKLLATLKQEEETPVKTPWWLLVLRLTLLTLIILAFAGPVWRAATPITLAGNGPILLVMESDWATAPNWANTKQRADQIIATADRDGRPLGLIAYPQPTSNPPLPGDANTARALLETLSPQPVESSRRDLVTTVQTVLNSSVWDNATVVWMTNGLQSDDVETDLNVFERLIIVPGTPPELTLSLQGGSLGPTALITPVEGFRTDDSLNSPGRTITAYDGTGRPLASTSVLDQDGAIRTSVQFDLPLTVRNDIARIALTPTQHAGHVVLVDDRLERRRVAIVGAERTDEAQPLLSGSTYVQRALVQVADVIVQRSGDTNGEVGHALSSGADVIVLVGTTSLIPSTTQALNSWIEAGGVLIRFASSGLAESADPLLPVPLRAVDRQLGGALTWEEPQTIAPFAAESPFAGLVIPEDVRIERQILSEPGASLSSNTLAELADATPLVSSQQRGEGYSVLFHVTADTGWSNLPLSGLFVDMLSRLLELAVPSGSRETAATTDQQTQALSPQATLNADGLLSAPPAHAEGLTITGGTASTVTLSNPPGFYGQGPEALGLNLFLEPPSLRPHVFTQQALLTIDVDQALPLRPSLVVGAVGLAFADAIVVLILSGALAGMTSSLRRGHLAPVVLVTICLYAMAAPQNTFAQDSQNSADTSLSRLIAAANTTRLAYVLTGDAELDQRSREGLQGLTRLLTQRTAFEPGAPFGVDPDQDELAFYPLIYWPLPETAMAVPETLVTRIDAYMSNGGTILFDTRDETHNITASGISMQTNNLRALLAALDIPPLEPVPDDHVLTKSFYLLDSFPGRYATGPLWVEALPPVDQTGAANRPARGGDGVSPLLITGNDLASAWALSSEGRPLYATSPPDPLQREYAYRTGINIAMYVMTGNYKADQVHIPALLERLVQ